jgi:hypothetical protein
VSEEVPGVSKEEGESPIGVEEEEEPPPTSSLSRPSQRREEERCDSGWSFPPPTYVREKERYIGGWSFPPRGMREEEWCGSREKQISRSGLGPSSSRTPIAC